MGKGGGEGKSEIKVILYFSVYIKREPGSISIRDLRICMIMRLDYKGAGVGVGRRSSRRAAAMCISKLANQPVQLPSRRRDPHFIDDKYRSPVYKYLPGRAGFA